VTGQLANHSIVVILRNNKTQYNAKMWQQILNLRYFHSKAYKSSMLSAQKVSMIYLYQGWPNLLYVWAAYRKTQVTKNHNIKIGKHKFICNLCFCDIINLFRTTCKSNTVWHTSCHSAISQYFNTLQQKWKIKYKHI